VNPRVTRHPRGAAWTRALVQNIGAVITWSIAPSMIRAISGSFPVNFQNSARYLVSLAVLWPVLALSTDRAGLRALLSTARAHAPRIVVVALVNYAFQACYTWSLSMVTPAVMTLVSQTQVIFGVFLALALFPDERAIVKSPLFIAGLLLALAGVGSVVAGGRSFGSPSFGLGVLVVVGSAASWALLGALLRKWLPGVPPLLSLASVFTVVTPLFVATYAIAHPGFPIPRAPPLHWVLLVGSGLLAIALGHSLFYRAVPVLGVSVSTSINLLTPFLASVVSFLAFGETLTALQLAGAGVLIGGSYLVIRTRFRSGRAEPAAALGEE
jgi:drug/metabolite transporter (DMT)-like permease